MEKALGNFKPNYINYDYYMKVLKENIISQQRVKIDEIKFNKKLDK